MVYIAQRSQGRHLAWLIPDVIQVLVQTMHLRFAGLLSFVRWMLRIFCNSRYVSWKYRGSQHILWDVRRVGSKHRNFARAIETLVQLGRSLTNLTSSDWGPFKLLNSSRRCFSVLELPRTLIPLVAAAKFNIVEGAPPGLSPAPALAVSTLARPPLSMPTRGRIFVVDIIDVLLILAMRVVLGKTRRTQERQRASLDPGDQIRSLRNYTLNPARTVVVTYASATRRPIFQYGCRWSGRRHCLSASQQCSQHSILAPQAVWNRKRSADSFGTGLVWHC